MKINKKYLLFLSVFATPFYLLVVRLSKGNYLPSLIDKDYIWNIQYLPASIASFLIVLLLIINSKLIKFKYLYVISLCFNLFLGLLFLFTTIYLWGEKY